MILPDKRMERRMLISGIVFAIVGISLMVFYAWESSGPNMVCQVKVPNEYQKESLNPPPNGEPEAIRYQKSYEAFWWNCVMVKADDLEARCPFVCSGTPDASTGCADGESDAARQIDNLLSKYSKSKVQQYLHSIAASAEAKKKIYPYFQETPQPEKFSSKEL